jgi:hypothetical protein
MDIPMSYQQVYLICLKSEDVSSHTVLSVRFPAFYFNVEIMVTCWVMKSSPSELLSIISSRNPIIDQWT